jgi:hypothetical protein
VDADVGGAWRRPNVSRKLAKRDCAPIRFAETAQLPFVLAR